MANVSTGNLLIPGSVVVAGLLIAAAIIYGGKEGSSTIATGGHDNGLPGGRASEVRDVSSNDHIRGNSNASVFVVEYSDYECPFCARFHPTLERIVEENDDVAWVYRHFPLTQIHSQAQRSAVAAECIARLGGNDAFWQFSDALFQNQRSLGDSLYEREAARLGIDAPELRSCMSEQSIEDKVTADFNNAVAAGGRGTPFSVIVTASGAKVPVSGALPYEQFRGLIEQARTN